MKNKILFISEGTVLNPIIHSQGLPLLNSLSKNGFECYFISFERDNNPAIEKAKEKYDGGINFITIYLNDFKLIPSGLDIFVCGIWSAIKIIKQKNISLIHARSLFPAVIALVIKLFIPKIQFIYDNRGVFIEEEIYKGHWKKKGLKTRIFRFLEKMVFKKTNHIVVVSEAFRRHMLTQCQYLDLKMTVIPNRAAIIPVDREKFLWENRGSNLIAVYNGSAAAWQGVSELKSIFNKFIAVFPNGKFRIISYHPKDFEMEFKDLLKDTRLEIISGQSKKVFDQLLECNFGILVRQDNLINNTASPLKFAEYLSAGLPVLASAHIGDIKGFVEQSKTGAIIKNNNYERGLYEMKNLLQEHDIYQRCREIAKKQMNLESTFIQYENIYKFFLNYEK